MGRKEDIRGAISEEAAERLLVEQDATLPEAKRRELLVWLRASPQHVEEYLRAGIAADVLAVAARRSDFTLDTLTADALAADNAGVVPLRRASLPTAFGRRHSARWLTLSAAAVAVVTIASLWIMDARDGRRFGLPLEFKTARGQQLTARLSDGSTLRLNTDSAVTARFSRRQRVLEIERGEVFVSASHDPARAFRVTAGLIDVVAVGTEFDVFRNGSTTTVTVVEGKVAVAAAARASAATPRRDLAQPLYVASGQQVRVVDDVVPNAPVAVDLRQAVGWLQRQIVFDQQPLGVIAAEFNRYSRVPVRINDPALAATPVSGVFDPFDTESFTTLLKALDGVDVETTPTQISVRLRSTPPANRKQ